MSSVRNRHRGVRGVVGFWHGAGEGSKDAKCRRGARRAIAVTVAGSSEDVRVDVIVMVGRDVSKFGMDRRGLADHSVEGAFLDVSPSDISMQNSMGKR